ncbi:hypothetical protein VTO73DRAFT_1702 [Trametes versicolor]
MSVSFFRVLSLFSFFSSFIAANGQSTNSASNSVSATYGSLSGSPPVDLDLISVDDEEYLVDIVLGGQTFRVIVDTGSTDLWLDLQGLDIPLTNTTDLIVDTQYAIGEVKGNVLFAELRLGPYVIPSQAFINATNVTAMPEGTQGLMGMAFDTTGIYVNMLEAWSRDTANELARGPMSNLIAQNASAPGFFDLRLGRTYANGTELNGHMLIGQHLEGAEAVESAPKLERVDLFHWVVAMDGMNINGKPFTGWNKSIVAGVPEGKVAAVFDSGFTTSAFPKELIDAIYGSIPGAVRYNGSILDTDNGAGLDNWIVPCNASANISFVFAGQEYPVHPLDVVNFYTNPLIGEQDGISIAANASICTNRFFAGDHDESYDILLGMGFLRNVYGSFHYGNYTPPGANITGQLPYVQLLSVTDKDTAWGEYYEYYTQKVLQGSPEVDPATWPKFIADINSDDSDSSDDSSSSVAPAGDLEVAGAVADGSGDSPSSNSDSNKYGPIALGLLGANVAIGLAILVVTLTLCIRSAKGKREARYAPLRLPKEAGIVDPERATLYSD